MLEISYFSLVIILFGTLLTISGCGSDSTIRTPDTSPILKKISVSVGNVTPVTIYSSTDVGDEYLIHAANILAGYLDNDSDGNWDNAQLVSHLSDIDAVLFIPKDDKYFDISFNNLPALYRDKFNHDLSSQALYESEIKLCNTDSFRDCFSNAASVRDPSYEEILHLITHSGYSQLYPSVYGESYDQNSTIALANDKARGDISRSLNNMNNCSEIDGEYEYECEWYGKYASSAWYTYEDPTCDYDCMVTEYTYWTINAGLGMLEYLSGVQLYSEEYKCLTISSFESGGLCEDDVGIAAIWGAGSKIEFGHLVVGSNPYQMPTRIPYGTYSPNGSDIEWEVEMVY